MRTRAFSWILGLGALVSFGFGCGPQDEELGVQRQLVSVTWGTPVNVDAVGSNLTKTGTALAWDAGAVSNETLTGDGYVEFSTSENNMAKMAGLSSGDTDQGYADIDFAFYMGPNGMLYVYENGAYRATIGAYAANDIFRVSTTGGEVNYYQNGTLVYSSAGTASGTLLLDTSLFAAGATIINAAVTASGGGSSWQNVVGANTTSNSVTKTATTGWGTAGASSTATISGDGYVEFTTAEANTDKFAGLNATDGDQGYAEIDYAIFLRADGVVLVFENGVYRGTYGTYVAGDVFRVQVASNVVRYYRNGSLLYTSLTTPAATLLFDCALGTQNSTITGLTFSGSGAFWQNNAGVTVATNNITRLAGLGWTAGASSASSLSGDGYVEFSTAETNRYKMAGLSSGDSNKSYTDIDYAFYLQGGGNLYIYEGGVYRRTIGTYVAGDVFRVQVNAGVVTYYQNGGLVYTSQTLASAPLLLDTSLYDAGATIQNASVVPAAGSAIWQNQSGVSEVGGNSLVKISTTAGFNAGASTQASLAADGYAEFTTGETNTAKMAGLSVTDANRGYAEIAYAVYLRNDGAVIVFENGNYRGTFGTYVAGDVFRVQVTGTTVTYLRNGSLFYTSLVARPGSPLLLDTSLSTTGATINNVTLVSQ